LYAASSAAVGPPWPLRPAPAVLGVIPGGSDWGVDVPGAPGFTGVAVGFTGVVVVPGLTGAVVVVVTGGVTGFGTGGVTFLTLLAFAAKRATVGAAARAAANAATTILSPDT